MGVPPEECPGDDIRIIGQLVDRAEEALRDAEEQHEAAKQQTEKKLKASEAEMEYASSRKDQIQRVSRVFGLEKWATPSTEQFAALGASTTVRSDPPSSLVSSPRLILGTGVIAAAYPGYKRG